MKVEQDRIMIKLEENGERVYLYQDDPLQICIGDRTIVFEDVEELVRVVGLLKIVVKYFRMIR